MKKTNKSKPQGVAPKSSRPKRPKPIARTIKRLIAEPDHHAPDFSKAPEGRSLPDALSAAVPLWMLRFQGYSAEERQEEIDRLNSEGVDFCMRMEYVLHKGPKPGDSAKAFNDLAKTIALLSFAPGGVSAFGSYWEWKK